MPVFEVYKSLGLFWVREYDFHDANGGREVILHGPFMDAANARVECDNPPNWRVMFR